MTRGSIFELETLTRSVSGMSSKTLADFHFVRGDARVPQEGVAAQARTEHVDLQLGGAAGASIDVILADVRIAGRQRRHHFIQMRDAVKGVLFVIFIRNGGEVNAARAA